MGNINEFLRVESGDGSGAGYSYGAGSGSGRGSGSGYGDGYGSGYGYGYDNDYAIKNFCGERVFAIDNTPTIIRSAHGNLAKGFVLQGDFKLIPCYIAKHDNMFAHGETIQEAVAAVNKKVLKNMDSDKVIDKFFDISQICLKSIQQEIFSNGIII